MDLPVLKFLTPDLLTHAAFSFESWNAIGDIAVPLISVRPKKLELI